MIDRIKQIVSDMGGDDMLKEIPNSVYRLVTVQRDALNSSVVVSLDVTLADQYGRLSLASKCYTHGIILDESVLAQRDREKAVHGKVIEALQFLQEKIRGGKNSRLWEVVPPVEV